MTLAVFDELPPTRKREASSVVAHYIAGVLGREEMAEIVEGLWQSATLSPGDRVRTLRGSLHGVITRVLEDGRVAWKADGGSMALLAQPESLTRE